MAKDSTYRPNVYRERGGNRFVVAASGVQRIDGGSLNVGVATATEGGTIAFATNSQWNRGVITATQNQTLDGSEAGISIVSQVADLNHQLPQATGNQGAQYRFTAGTGALSGATTATGGLKIHPQSPNKIVGGGLSAATNNILQLSGATDAVGDFVTVESDGVASWHIVGIQGSWAMTTATG